MPQFRKHPVTHEWVVIATERGKRPSDFNKDIPEIKPTFSEKCPFCPGHESQTPPEVLAYRPVDTDPNTPGWTTRVVSNKFPALQIEGDLCREGVGMYDFMNGIGAHEVIIETPRHDLQIGNLPHKMAVDAWLASKDRMLDLDRDERFKYALLFRNYGKVAGASLEHPHSQLIAMPMIPHHVRLEIEGARRFYQYHERCIFCDMIRQERNFGQRIVEETDDFIVFSPFAPKYPFETWVLPKRHNASFTEESEEDIEGFSRIVQHTLMRVANCLGDPPYNYMLHSSPYAMEGDPQFHWHLEIIPRLTIAAGFEMGTGIFINVTSPEDAALHLREASPEPSIQVEASAAAH